ncbi:anti-sigma factor [Pseudomonas huanghezhanensis]|uniref:anti-sigma factor n=1 Tax=Pseudomonas huanghezhanensis TaxID=3002903 RepID=UPI0022853DFE|nr:anti-sigma factor [Pseudomonas sp. BSw22131]
MNYTPGNARDPDLQTLAGEYVLGTLSTQQRKAVELRLPHEPALQAAVDEWEERLLDLTRLAQPQTPSPHLWGRIERSVDAFEPPIRGTRPNSTSRWWDNLAVWRGLTGMGLAASLVLGIALVTQMASPPAPSYLVVLVAPQDKAPGWVIQTSDSREIQLIPLGMADVPQDKALQFWTKGDDWKGPVSLGLVKPGQVLKVPLDKLPKLQANQLFELTLETTTGSPTGKPTGPIQAIGRAVKVI